MLMVLPRSSVALKSRLLACQSPRMRTAPVVRVASISSMPELGAKLRRPMSTPSLPFSATATMRSLPLLSL